jgi:solute carrier family 25 (mitochondrial oxoglutarate transporter), member 11
MAAAPAKKEQTIFDKVRPFLIGGISGMIATTVVQPIDTVKVRIQLAGEAKAKGGSVNTNPLSVGRTILANEGLGALYKGLDAGLVRQATYTTARLGIYTYLFESQKSKYGKVEFGAKLWISSVAGFLGALVGTPADLALVRFQSDSTLPVNQRRNYKNVADAFARIIKEEGFLSLWKGSTPTVVRALALNMMMLTSNDEIKERLTKMRGLKKADQTSVFTASAISGFLSSFVSLPFDNIKTKLQKQKAGPDGSLQYTSFFDCFRKTVAKDGISGLWIGFFPTYYIRIAPHIMITLIAQDFLTKLMTPKTDAK